MKKRHVLLAAPLVLFAVLLTAFWVGQVYLRSRVASPYSRLEAAGYPLTLEALDRWYKRPEGENAADLYAKAFALLKASPPSPEQESLLPFVKSRLLPPVTEPLSPECRRAGTEYVERHRATLDLLRQAGRSEGARYDIDLTQGTDVGLPHLEGHRAAASLLALDAVLAAENGDAGTAVESLVAIFRLGESLAEEPLLISQLCRIGNHESGLCALERVLTHLELADEHLSRLMDEFDRVERRDTFYRGCVGETVMGMTVFTTPVRIGDETTAPSRRSERRASYLSIPLVGLVDYGWFLEAQEINIAASRAPIEERLARARDADERNADSPMLAIMSPLLTAGSNATVANVRAVAELRCARTALAIERYRLVHGSLPDELEALTPDYLDSAPEDPCTAGPLRYVLTGDGYCVYSVGTDQKDDGGRPRAGQREAEFTGRPGSGNSPLPGERGAGRDLIFEVGR